ncbi:MAG: DMT family transporter [Alphaproteobacteria bacterium]|nr:DMT family transporter [Alphaproteobacteria bacterium]
MSSGSPSNLRGIGFLLAGAGTFVLNDSFLKMALVELPPYEVLVMRGISGIICAVVLLAVMGDLRKFTTGSKPFVFLRGILEVFAILSYILALAHAPIGDVTAIFQITPLLVILGMIFIHREQALPLRMVLVVIGFAGAIFVAQPGFGTASPYVMFAFVTALFAALRDLAGRYVSPEIPALVATLITIIMVALGAAAVGLVTEQWLMPSSRSILLMAGAGLFMMLGHMFTFLAYRNASAQAVAPFYYSFMVWAVAAGYVIFGDIPNLYAMIGMSLILASGLGIAFMERQHSRTAN